MCIKNKYSMKFFYSILATNRLSILLELSLKTFFTKQKKLFISSLYYVLTYSFYKINNKVKTLQIPVSISCRYNNTGCSETGWYYYYLLEFTDVQHQYYRFLCKNILMFILSYFDYTTA